MDYCPIVKRPGAKIREGSGSAPGRWRRCFRGGRVDAFTFIELLLMVSIIGILCGIAAPIYSDYTYRAQVETAKAIIRELEAGINVYKYRYGTYPATLSDAMIATPVDPWGNPYYYLSSTDPSWGANQRMDRHMRPLNNDFDLLSIGRDGKTATFLANRDAQDDVVRVTAN
jgi:Tfp pilus assembly protein PilE